MALADLFNGIAEAIRGKDGTTEAIVANTFPERIRAIPSGGSSTLTSISITTPPKKTEYILGETFDPSGMVVTAAFSSGETVEVDETGVTFEPSGALSDTDTQVTVSMTFGGVTQTAVQPISVISSRIIGVMWDSTKPSTAMTRLTVETDPYHLVNTDITTEPAPAVGNSEGSSPFDNYAPWNGMEEYNIIDGEVAYKRGDEGFSRSEYDTMVLIPEYWMNAKLGTNGEMDGKFYFYTASQMVDGFMKHPGSGKYVGRYKTSGGTASKTGTAQFSFASRSTARVQATQKGNKWCQNDFATFGAYEYLFRIEFADWDSQAKIGRGYVDGNGNPINNGGTDFMTYHTGRAAGTDGKTAVQYRHIENPIGNGSEWLDGINVNNRIAYICLDHTKYDDNTDVDYVDSGVTLPSETGYIKNIGLSSTFPWAFLPTEAGGSDTTYIPDRVSFDYGWRVVTTNNYITSASYAGLWGITASIKTSDIVSAIFSRLKYDPEEVAT